LGNGLLPSHRGMSINKDKLTGPVTKPSPWLTRVYVPVPGQPGRYIPLILPLPAGLGPVLRHHAGRPRSVLITLFLGALLFVNVRLFMKKIDQKKTPGTDWKQVVTDVVKGADTVVFSQDELRKIYEWEIWGGNYPTRRRSE
jgi:hypothetical protein